MNRIEKSKKKINDFLFDHFMLKRSLYQAKGVFIALLSAFIFAFGFCSFISPSASASGDYNFKIITGGISGISQNLAKVLEMCGVELTDTTVEALGYTLFNIPIAIFAFFAIGKRFAIMTVINVVASSLFINFIPDWGFSKDIAASEIIMCSPLSRVFFGGMCTGLASALAFKAEISCGGIDVITYYYAMRKSTSVGKYGVFVNAIIVTTYATLLTVQSPSDWEHSLITVLYSIVYLFVVMLVVDSINLRNKKVSMQFITSREDMASILLAHFPHGATITRGYGAYSQTDRYIVYMVVSSFEVNRVVALAKQIDRHVFISATALIQVYGNFFIRPIN